MRHFGILSSLEAAGTMTFSQMVPEAAKAGDGHRGIPGRGMQGIVGPRPSPPRETPAPSRIIGLHTRRAPSRSSEWRAPSRMDSRRAVDSAIAIRSAEEHEERVSGNPARHSPGARLRWRAAARVPARCRSTPMRPRKTRGVPRALETQQTRRTTTKGTHGRSQAMRTSTTRDGNEISFREGPTHGQSGRRPARRSIELGGET